MNKKLMRQILFLVFLSALIIWSVFNFDIILNIAGTALKVLIPVILGGAIAFIVNIPMKMFEKLFDKLFKKFKKPVFNRLRRVISLFLAMLLIIGIILALVFVIVPRVAETFSSFTALLPGYLKTLEGYIAELSEFFKTLDITIPKLDIDTNKLLSTFDFVSKQSSSFLGSTIDATTSIFSAVFNFFMAFTFSVYLLLDKEKVSKRLKKTVFALLPDSWAKYIVSVANRTDKAFSSFITGQLTEAVILGTLCYIGMKILGMPQAGLISTTVGFTALVPVMGAWIGAIFGAFIILLTNPAQTLIFLVYLILLQQVETNLIYPRVVGKSVGIPGILVLLSVSVGGNLFGVAGMIISVPLCSVLYSIFKEATDYLYLKKHPGA